MEEEERLEEEEAPLLEEERLEEEEAPLLEEERLEEEEAPLLEEERLEEEERRGEEERREDGGRLEAEATARRRVPVPPRRRTALLSTAAPMHGLVGHTPPACLTCLAGCTSPPSPPRRLTRPSPPFAAPWPPTRSTTRSTS